MKQVWEWTSVLIFTGCVSLGKLSFHSHVFQLENEVTTIHITEFCVIKLTTVEQYSRHPVKVSSFPVDPGESYTIKTYVCNKGQKNYINLHVVWEGKEGRGLRKSSWRKYICTESSLMSKKSPDRWEEVEQCKQKQQYVQKWGNEKVKKRESRKL